MAGNAFQGLKRLLVYCLGPLDRKNILGWIQILALVLLIRCVGCEPFYVPSGSMEPTLHGDPRFFRGDRVAVDKLAYGPRIPFTKIRPVTMGHPKRWDIVVFDSVDENAEFPVLIKRIVALPGERVHIADGKLWINGVVAEPPEHLKGILKYSSKHIQTEKDLRHFVLQLAQSSDPASGFNNPTRADIARTLACLERIRDRMAGRAPDSIPPDEVEGLMLEFDKESRAIVGQYLEFAQQVQFPLVYGILTDDQHSLVPEGHYLVCGDNTAESLDGRYFGWLPEKNIVGRAFCIWWPIPRWCDLTGFSHHWWGILLLYGVPAALIASELFSWWRRRSAAERESDGSGSVSS